MSFAVNMMSDLARSVVAGQDLVKNFSPKPPPVEFYNIRLGLGSGQNISGTLPSVIVTDKVDTKFFSAFEGIRIGSGIAQPSRKNQGIPISFLSPKDQRRINGSENQEFALQTSPASNGFNLKAVDIQGGSDPICVSNIIIKTSDRTAAFFHHETFIPIGDLGFLCGLKWSWGTVLDGNRQRCIWLDGRSDEEDNKQPASTLHLNIEEMSKIFKPDKSEELKKTDIETVCQFLSSGDSSSRENDNSKNTEGLYDVDFELKIRSRAFAKQLQNSDDNPEQQFWDDKTVDTIAAFKAEESDEDQNLNPGQLLTEAALRREGESFFGNNGDTFQEKTFPVEQLNDRNIVGEMPSHELFSKQTIAEQLYSKSLDDHDEPGWREEEEILENNISQDDIFVEEETRAEEEFSAQVSMAEELEEEMVRVEEEMRAEEFAAQVSMAEELEEEMVRVEEEMRAEEEFAAQVSMAEELEEEMVRVEEEMRAEEFAAQVSMAEELEEEMVRVEEEMRAEEFAAQVSMAEELEEEMVRAEEEMRAEEFAAQIPMAEKFEEEMVRVEEEMRAEEFAAQVSMEEELEEEMVRVEEEMRAEEEFAAQVSMAEELEEEMVRAEEEMRAEEFAAQIPMAEKFEEEMVRVEEEMRAEEFAAQVSMAEELEEEMVRAEEEMRAEEEFAEQVSMTEELEEEIVRAEEELLSEEIIEREMLLEEELLAEQAITEENIDVEEMLGFNELIVEEEQEAEKLFSENVLTRM